MRKSVVHFAEVFRLPLRESFLVRRDVIQAHQVRYVTIRICCAAVIAGVLLLLAAAELSAASPEPTPGSTSGVSGQAPVIGLSTNDPLCAATSIVSRAGAA